MSAHRRESDRWITPRVIVVALLCGTFLAAVIAAGVVYLTSLGVDPDPMLNLVGNLVTAIGTLGTLTVTLAARAGTAKVERNTGMDLPAKVDELAAKVDAALWVDESHTKTLPPVPPLVRSTERHPFVNGA